MLVKVENYEQSLSNLEKIFWPKENIDKKALIKYYLEVQTYLLPHLRNRPMVMKRYPNGILKDFFYQKQCPTHAPEWIEKIFFDKYAMVTVNNADILIWLINLGCIEIHPWLSSKESLINPDIIVFDLDPEPPAGLDETFTVALIIEEILKAANLKGYIKTSGSQGLHIYVPILPMYSFATIKESLKKLCSYIVSMYPHLMTIEMKKENRKGKVYLDYLQNGYGKTMASVYSVRPVPGALVSTPLTWDEVRGGVCVQEFNIFSVEKRLSEKGDIFAPVYQSKQDFTPVIRAL